MTGPTRFDKDMDGSMEPSEHGRWVMFDDTRPLTRRLEAAQRLADAVQAFLDGHETGVRTLPSMLHDWKEANK